MSRQGRAGLQPRDAVALDQHGLAVEQHLPGEDPGAREGLDARHHSVSVTLRRWLGRSGSCPRARLSASAKP